MEDVGKSAGGCQFRQNVTRVRKIITRAIFENAPCCF